jgi:hypothetical protein
MLRRAPNHPTSKTRMSVAAIALGLAILGMFMAGNFVFSGDATRYAQFVQARIRDWLITAAFASFALAVSVPVLWQSTWRQIFLATVFILLAALVLVITYGVLA